MNRNTFTIAATLIAGCATLATLPSCTGCSGREYRERPQTDKKLIILGIDGMDPTLLRKYIREGRVPNLARMAETGAFMDLQTTDPPQSPVAWSTFITGQDLDGHGIFDFVHRDPIHLSSYLSTSRYVPEKTILGVIPNGGGEHELLRGGQAFWQALEEQNIGASMVKIPANFPPTHTDANESMSGMGTPDLMGTYGTFQLYTDEEEWRDADGKAVPIKSAEVHLVDFSQTQVVEARFSGPTSSACFGECKGELISPSEEQAEYDKRLALPLAERTAYDAARGPYVSELVESSACFTSCYEDRTAAITIAIDKQNSTAMIDLAGAKLVLKAGEWSEWIPVDYGVGLTGSPSDHGMVRFYLRGVSPFRLYVSPINLDPLDSDLPISEPPSWAEEMAQSVGRFYTQGMAEDTKALSGGVLSDEEFLAQANIIFEERVGMLRHEMKTYRDGLLFFYFSSIDQTSHMYYGSMEPDAPEHYAKYKHVIPELYTRMDAIVGEVLEWAGDTPVVIMSDHGFAPWTYKVNLNTWLAEQGYLALLPPPKKGEPMRKGLLSHIDWEHTQAYALGLNQLFLNVADREPHGVIGESERAVVLQRLKRDLESWRYSETGERVVTEAMAVPAGVYTDREPDLIVGYNRGFRSSDASALGAVGGPTIERNTGHWNGDHCMHASHVPGVLLSTIPLDVDVASLADFAPTVLRYFGVTPPEKMKGQMLFASPVKAAAK